MIAAGKWTAPILLVLLTSRARFQCRLFFMILFYCLTTVGPQLVGVCLYLLYASEQPIIRLLFRNIKYKEIGAR